MLSHNSIITLLDVSAVGHVLNVHVSFEDKDHILDTCYTL